MDIRQMRRVAGKREGKVTKYLQVRIDMLREEKNKTDNKHTHMILDKGIIELTYVLELAERSNQPDE